MPDTVLSLLQVLTKTLRGVFSLFQKMLDSLLPDSCVLCNALITMGDNSLCSRCKSSIKRHELCEQPAESDRYIFYESHHQLFTYSRNLLKLLYAFKNGGRLNLSRFFLSSLCFDTIPEFDMVTYVPSSPRKYRKRGFCHTQILAKEIARRCAKPCRLLLKEHNRFQQKCEHFDGRFLNTIGQFEYISRPLDGARVLLLDDVLTTGATVNECARILKKNGAGTVLSLTISRVPVKYQKKTE